MAQTNSRSSIGRTTHRSAMPARQPIPASPTSQPDGSARSTQPIRWKVIFPPFPQRHLPTCRRMPTRSNDRRPPLARSADRHVRGRFSEHSPLDRSAVRTCPSAHPWRDSDARHPGPHRWTVRRGIATTRRNCGGPHDTSRGACRAKRPAPRAVSDCRRVGAIHHRRASPAARFNGSGSPRRAGQGHLSTFGG